MEMMQYYRRYDTGYPEILNRYERMPAGLWLRGNFPDPDKKTVAIVGARTCSSYGRKQALRFAEALARENVQIVSGLAHGIDSCAHQGALNGGGKTYAVLGCGVDICYPKENFLLYEEMLKKGGGILSEYEPGAGPLAWHFPVRNRIISALADLVLVVEARKKSGSLITADYALEQGKSVYAVPGRVGDACSEGCNHLISQGAGIAFSPDVILNELFPTREEEEKAEGERSDALRKSRAEQLTAEQKQAFACLEVEAKSLEQLCAETKIPERNLVSDLTILCLENFAVSDIPGYYRLSD